MPTGKPDFNLNSYGVKYLSKEEVQEFLEKQTKVYNYEPPTGQDQAALRAERAKKPKETFQASESAKKLVSEVKPAETTPEPKAISSTISAPNAAGDKELQGGTRSVFNDDKYGVPRRGGSLKNPTHSAGRGTSGYIKDKQPTQSNPERSGAGNAPSTLPKGNKTDMKVGRRKVTVGTGEKGKKEFDEKEGKGETWYAADDKQPNSELGVKRQQKKDKKSKKIGIEQSKIHEEKRRKDIETLQSQKPKDRKTYDTIQNDNTQGINYDSSPTRTSSTDTTEANVETESDASFKRRLRANEEARKKQELKNRKETKNPDYRKVIEEHRSTRGLGKSNDIITEMNIMKLDLMKTQNTFQERSTNARISPSGDTKHIEDFHQATPLREASTLDGRVGNTAPLERKDPPNQMGGKTGHAGSMPKQTGKRGTPKVDPRMRKKDPIKTIPKTASETIFKAISLKLDLTKTLK